MASLASIDAPIRFVSLAQGSRSLLASKAHSREQYFPAFLPEDRLLKGRRQQRHCGVFARSLDAITLFSMFFLRASSPHAVEQYRLPCRPFSRTNSEPHAAHWIGSVIRLP